MLAHAYQLGVSLAMRDSGLTKEARWPWEEEPNAFSSWVPWAAGGALGLGSAALMRHPIKVDPKKFPVLRKIQDMSKGNMLVKGEEKPGKTVMEKLKNWLTISSADAPRNTEALYRGGEVPKAKRKTFDPVLGPQKGEKAVRHFESSSSLTNDKLRQAELLRKYAPETTAQTLDIEKVMKEEGIKLRPQTLAKDLTALQTALQKRFSGKKFILKTKGERVGGDPAIQSHLSSFPTGDSDWYKLHQGWKKIRAPFHAISNSEKAVKKFRGHQAYPGRVIEEVLQNNALAQEILPLHRYEGELAKSMRAAGQEPTKAYRIHSIGGKAIPSLAFPRYRTSSYRDAIEYIKARRVANWFQKEVLDKLPEKERGISYAADIGALEGDKGYKVLELNSAFDSGFLQDPRTRHFLHRAVTGASSKPVTALAAPTIGGLGAIGTGVGMNLAQD